LCIAALVGALNDRLLLACANDPNPRQKQGVEIKTRLVGLLEPLLVGWTTMQRVFEPKLDLLEIMYQLTSRFCGNPPAPFLRSTWVPIALIFFLGVFHEWPMCSWGFF
jgi:hypothetical protein